MHGIHMVCICHIYFVYNASSCFSCFFSVQSWVLSQPSSPCFACHHSTSHQQQCQLHSIWSGIFNYSYCDTPTHLSCSVINVLHPYLSSLCWSQVDVNLAFSFLTSRCLSTTLSIKRLFISNVVNQLMIIFSFPLISIPSVLVYSDVCVSVFTRTSFLLPLLVGSTFRRMEHLEMPGWTSQAAR